MLPKTAHTSELLSQYSIAISNGESPIIFLADETNCFLNLTISYILNTNQIYYIPRTINHQHKHRHGNHGSHMHNKLKYNNHDIQTSMHLPIIGFADIILEQERLMEFILDLGLKNLKSSMQFLKRKKCMLQSYRFWKRIIQWQKSQSSDFEALQILGINSSKDYQNILYEKLQILNVQIVGKTLVKNFQSYSEAILNIQQVFYSDIVQSILKTIPSSTPDYILRGYFPVLLDKCSDHAKKANEVQRTQKENCQNLQIMLLRSSGLREAKQYPSFQTHAKAFSISMTVLIGIYIIDYLRNDK